MQLRATQVFTKGKVNINLCQQKITNNILLDGSLTVLTQTTSRVSGCLLMPDKEGADTDGARESECSGAESGRVAEDKNRFRETPLSLSPAHSCHTYAS